MQASGRVRVAVIREEGSNGDREMAAAVYSGGMEPWDVTMSDLLNGRASLDSFQGQQLQSLTVHARLRICLPALPSTGISAANATASQLTSSVMDTQANNVLAKPVLTCVRAGGCPANPLTPALAGAS